MKGPCCAAWSAWSCWAAGVLLPVAVAPAFHFFPTRPLWRSLGNGTPRAGNGIPAGQRPGEMVALAEPEPCGLFVPNGGPQCTAVLLSTGDGVLSTIAVRLVRLVRSGGLEFVPFCSLASCPLRRRLTGPHDERERGSSPGGAYGHYLWRQRLDLRRSRMKFPHGTRTQPHRGS